MPVNVPYSQSMRRSTSHNYNTPRYHGPSSPKIDLLPADSRASDSQDMQGEWAFDWRYICRHVAFAQRLLLLHDMTVGPNWDCQCGCLM